jgi:hypothetical protein
MKRLAEKPRHVVDNVAATVNKIGDLEKASKPMRCGSVRRLSAGGGVKMMKATVNQRCV